MKRRIYLSISLIISMQLLQAGCGKKSSPNSPPADTTPPTVTAVHPADGAVDVPLDDSVVVTFSETVSWTPNDGGLFYTQPTTTWASDFKENKIVFTIADGLLPGTTYKATLSSTIEDEAGNLLGENFVWTFSTKSVPPGITWTEHNLSLSKSLTSIAASSDAYVAVGTAGLVVRSTDGDIWDVIEAPTAVDLHKVIWADTLFIAVGDAELIMTSTDGIDWTVRRTGHPARAMNSLVYTGELYVAVGGHYTTPPSMLADVRTSTDAIEWTPETLDEDGCMHGIVWTGQRFVAVGFQTVNTYAIWTSENGHEWTLTHSVSAEAAHYEDVAWSGTTAIATGFDQSDLLYSTDGLQWSSRELALNHSSRAVVWTGDQFVAVGHFGHVYTSEDGVEWISRDPGINSDLYGVWGTIDRLAAVSGSIVLTSP